MRISASYLLKACRDQPSARLEDLLDLFKRECGPAHVAKDSVREDETDRFSIWQEGRRHTRPRYVGLDRPHRRASGFGSGEAQRPGIDLGSNARPPRSKYASR